VNIKVTTKPLRTILDLGHEPYRDFPWKPKGHRVFNGYRQHFVKGIRYENHK